MPYTRSRNRPRRIALSLILCLALSAPALAGCFPDTNPDTNPEDAPAANIEPAPAANSERGSAPGGDADRDPGSGEPGPATPAFNLSEGVARPDLAELPSELQKWVQNSRQIMLGQSRIFGDYRYILMTYGEKPTGGYDVTITELEEHDDRLEVSVELTEPEDDQPVTQALTYPYDLVVTEPTDLEVEFRSAVDEWPHIPILRGIDYLQPIVAGRDGIQVFAPAPDSTVSSRFLFRGISNVFEGTVNYRVESAGGDLLLEEFTTGAMGDWGYFRELVELPVDAPDELVLRVFYYSAKDGSIRNDFVIPLHHR